MIQSKPGVKIYSAIAKPSGTRQSAAARKMYKTEWDFRVFFFFVFFCHAASQN